MTGLAPLDRLEAAIVTSLLRSGPLTRSELAAVTAVDPSTIARTVPSLTDSGWLVDVLDQPNLRVRGRPSRQIGIRRRHHVAIGIKIGPDLVTGMVTDLTATPLRTGHRELARRDPEHVLETVSDLAAELAGAALESADDPSATVVGVGVGLGGHIVDARYCRASHLMGWSDVDLTRPIAEATGLPAIASNDVNTLAVAHHWYGAGHAVDDLAVVTIGRGIGCGLIQRGRLQVGFRGSAGELGHIPMDADGPPCGCGRRGCLESIAGEAALLNRVRAVPGHEQVKSLAAVIELARAGDEAALAAFADVGAALGRGIATLVCLTNPELVILAGEMVAAIEFLEPTIRQSAAAHSFSTSWQDCTLVIDDPGNDLWARGAACIAVRATVRRPALITRPAAT